MPRTHRLDFAGARHHVMNRGARRAPVFGDDEARALFVDILAGLPGTFGVLVHGYAVMPNHYHLLLECPRGNLSRAMRHVGATFTQRLNARRTWDGPVFRGRFRNRLVGDERYWMHLLAYLHLNPVPSVVERPEDWPWTSHRAYVGLEPTPSWLTVADLLETFGSRQQLAAYVEDHRAGRATTPAGFDAGRLWSQGSTDLLHGTAVPFDDDRPRASIDAVREVVRVTGRTEDQLVEALRGRRDQRARWVTAWWLGRRAGLTHREIAHRLDCSAGAVAHMLGRLRACGDPEAAAWMEALDALRRGDRAIG